MSPMANTNKSIQMVSLSKLMGLMEAFFASLVWSADERYVAYIAEKPAPKASGYFSKDKRTYLEAKKRVLKLQRGKEPRLAPNLYIEKIGAKHTRVVNRPSTLPLWNAKRLSKWNWRWKDSVPDNFNGRQQG